MNNENQKWLWTGLVVVLIVLIVLGVTASVKHRSDEGVESSGTGLENNGAGATGAVSNTNSTQGGANSTGAVAVPTKPLPVISSLAPVSGRAGSLVTINGKNFTPSNNFVEFAGYNIGASLSNDSNHISFKIPATIKSCANGTCTNNIVPVAPGSYPVAVRNANGTSNIIYFTVIGPTATQ